MRSRLIPFRFTPAAWGLSGQPYEEAEIAYYYEGEEMETRLAKLRIVDPISLAKALLAIELKYEKITKYESDRRTLEIDGRAYDARAVLDVEFTHGKISEYDYGKSIIEIENEGIPRDVALLNHELAHGLIEPRDHAKAVATAQKIPWVGVVNDGFNHNLGVDGFSIELDWNQEWINYLKMMGYTGRNDTDIIDAWFVDVCTEQSDMQHELSAEVAYPFPGRPRGPNLRTR